MEFSLGLSYPGQVGSLSEQYLVSCVPHSDCSGGNICQVLSFLQRSGQALSSDVPYTGRTTACPARANLAAAIDTWSFIGDRTGSPTVDQIKAALFNHGPVVAAIYASSSPFRKYTGGVFGADDESVCTAPKRPFAGGNKTGHVITIVGWGTLDDGRTYWIVRNSYGPDWGEDGYMRILAGCSSVASRAAYVVAEPLNG
jgi:C1A family cysteine protease